MSRVPLSLRPDLPPLARAGTVYVAAHVVSDVAGARNALPPDQIDALLGAARRAGWSVNLLDANPRKLIVTFDDGRAFPDALADVLDAHDATAVFFACTAERIASYPDAPLYGAFTTANRAYVLARHVVGGHTDAHTHLGRLPAEAQEGELAASAERFADVFGFRPR